MTDIINHIRKSVRNAITFHLMISKVSMVQCQIQNYSAYCWASPQMPLIDIIYLPLERREKEGRKKIREWYWFDNSIIISLFFWIFFAYIHLSIFPLSTKLVLTKYPLCVRYYARHWGSNYGQNRQSHCPQGMYHLVRETDIKQSPNQVNALKERSKIHQNM